MTNDSALNIIILFGQGVALYIPYLYFLSWRWGIERPTLESMAQPFFALSWLVVFPYFRDADPGFPADLKFISTSMFVLMLAFMANWIIRRLLANSSVIKYGPLLYCEGRGWV